MDTYISSDITKDAMLVIPGGGYATVCHYREGEPVALAYSALGYNTFVLNYRTAEPGDVYPKQLCDAVSAVLYIKENAERFHINPDRVFAVGFSAGGHLAASLATMYNRPEVAEMLGRDTAAARPTAVVLSYPVTTLNDLTHEGSFIYLLGKPFSEITEEDKERYSIDTAVTEDTPPMFIWHTQSDELVPIEGTLLLARALRQKRVTFELTVYPYGPHGFALASPQTSKGLDYLVDEVVARWVVNSDEFLKTIK
jgi:acetyl esterase/lipase